MSYTALPMPDLWRRLAQNEAFSAFSLVKHTAEGLAQASFATAFSRAVDKAEQDGMVLPSAGQILREFAEGCGHTDLMGQQSHLEYYRTLLSAQEEQARCVWREKGRVYRVLGVTGGIALMLLLM